MKHEMLKVGMLLCSAAVLVACANGNKGGYVQFYHGLPLPATEVAVIKGHYSYRNGSAANDMVRIVEVDNRRVPNERWVAEGGDTVAVQPGLHTVRALYVSGYEDVDLYSYKTLQIEAKPGCRYEVATQLLMPSREIIFSVLPSPLAVGSREDCRIDEVAPSVQNNWKT